MSYTATVVNVMIASPGDVAAERQIIREVVHEWNSINAEGRRMVLMPVGWESHASPKMGAPAQSVISAQVLSASDLLVAVFWTRLGSPTANSPSGTVEEIREHMRAGKPAMIYFSQQPVRLDSVDDSQYKDLLRFRNECLNDGLVEFYESSLDFREKFARHLAQTVIREFPAPSSDSSPQQPLQISGDAKALLAEAAQDQSGQVMQIRTAAGLGIRTNGKEMADRGNRRSEAQWEAAVQDLIRAGFLRQSDSKGQVFSVTHAGYQAAEHLTQDGNS